MDTVSRLRVKRLAAISSCTTVPGSQDLEEQYAVCILVPVISLRPGSQLESELVASWLGS